MRMLAFATAAATLSACPAATACFLTALWTPSCSQPLLLLSAGGLFGSAEFQKVAQLHARLV